MSKDDKNPGLTQTPEEAAQGIVSIGGRASERMLEKAAAEALENAQKVVDGINTETEKDKPEESGS